MFKLKDMSELFLGHSNAAWVISEQKTEMMNLKAVGLGLGLYKGRAFRKVHSLKLFCRIMNLAEVMGQSVPHLLSSEWPD